MRNILCNRLIKFSSNRVFYSDVITVLSNPRVGPLAIIKISLVLLSACPDELISAPKIMTFLPKSKFVIEKIEQESNPIPYTE